VKTGDVVVIGGGLHGCSTALHLALRGLTLEQKILLAHQIALAVHAAHSQGILHRDLKPTRQWGYAGSVPGPTIETRSGQGLLVEWVNALPRKHLLPVDFNVHGAEANKPEVRTIAHVHGAKVPPHWHPTDENITVLQGSFMIGTGEVFDGSKVTPMGAGDFIFMPKTMRHFALCKGKTVIQVHGIGPFKINWLNPDEVFPTGAPAREKPKS